jgi:hypothetical protein
MAFGSFFLFFYRIRGAINKFRPEEHIWNNFTRKYYPGPDTTLASVLPPIGIGLYDDEKDDLLRCRICRRKTANYHDGMELGSKSAILTKLLKHEGVCVSSAAKKINPSRSKRSEDAETEAKTPSF